MALRFIVLLLLCSAGLSAQITDSVVIVDRFQLGVVAGMMNHEVDFTPTTNVQEVLGTNFGVALRYFDNKLVGFQAELTFANAGWTEEIDPDFSTPYERRTRYAELLILTQLSIGQGAVQPLLQAGPYLSFPLGDEETIPAEYVEPDSPAQREYYNYKLPFRVNYGAQVGAGLNLELGPLTIQAEGRFLVGFSDLIKTGTTVAATSRREGLGGKIGLFWALRR